MFSGLKHSNIIYVLANLLVLPATFIPSIDVLSNLSATVCFFLFLRDNFLISLVVCVAFLLKNNANYRFILLLKQKGNELSKSDYECVYLYAWCTLLRYFLIGIAVNQIFLSFK